MTTQLRKARLQLLTVPCIEIERSIRGDVLFSSSGLES